MDWRKYEGRHTRLKPSPWKLKRAGGGSTPKAFRLRPVRDGKSRTKDLMRTSSVLSGGGCKAPLERAKHLRGFGCGLEPHLLSRVEPGWVSGLRREDLVAKVG
jgi:hypothetical protein